MSTQLLKTGAMALGMLALLVLSYELGIKRGTTPETHVSASTSTAAPALEDPAQWNIAQGGEATQRHIDQGLGVGDIDPVTGRVILNYYDPMMPATKFEAPGKSPYMDMMLVPAYAAVGGTTDAGTVEISARMRQNSGIRVAAAVEGRITPTIRAVGNVEWNARDAFIMQARAEGFVERLYVHAPYERVTQGQELVALRIPEWVALQEEYLALGNVPGGDTEQLRDAARARMRQAGMDEEQLLAVTRSQRVEEQVILKAPLTGTITEFGIREGMTIQQGMTLFRLNGTATVWVLADIPESQSGLLTDGAPIRASSVALPGKEFEGRIESLLPEVDTALRTRKARIELDNPDGLLVPGMSMNLDIAGELRDEAVLIPSAAVIDTGERQVVMRMQGGGAFESVAVQTGFEQDGRVEILTGLAPGDQIVVSGQFLLDSEASLRGLEARLPAVEDMTTMPGVAP